MIAHRKAFTVLRKTTGPTRAIRSLDRHTPEDFSEILSLFDMPHAHVFAEDAFGDLFVDVGAIQKIVLTTDDVEDICDGIGTFAKTIASDPDHLIGTISCGAGRKPTLPSGRVTVSAR